MIDLMIIIVELHLSALASLQAFHVHGLNQVIHSNRTSQDKKFQLAGGNQFSVYKHDEVLNSGQIQKELKTGLEPRTTGLRGRRADHSTKLVR